MIYRVQRVGKLDSNPLSFVGEGVRSEDQHSRVVLAWTILKRVHGDYMLTNLDGLLKIS